MKARVKGEGVNEQSVLVPHLSARHPSWECAAAPRVADSISKRVRVTAQKEVRMWRCEM